eukprot:780155_1
MIPDFMHYKEEALNNKYAPITEKTWNTILRKCYKIMKMYANVSEEFDAIYADDEDSVLLTPANVHQDSDIADEDEQDDYTEQEQVFCYGKEYPKGIKAKYKNLKEEALNNQYAPITEKTWNTILRKCHKIMKGGFVCQKRNTWSRIIKENKIKMK